MKLSYAFAAGLLAVLSTGAQAQQTTETKVGVNLKGVSVTRKKGQGTSTKTTKVDLTRKGVAIARRRTNASARPMRVRSSNIKVLLDGDQVPFPDQTPIMENNSVLVPMRGVFEKMGGQLTWDRAKNTVTATRDGKTVVLPLESSTATVDGEKIALHQPAILLNGRAMVPLRFLSETLGAQVLWKAAEQTVTIQTGS
ncbi:copper amine oxidase N-terminal domain-containing protein [bacterium]|nr:MAG: copper amine oxidase N-terminal domain-containing protein [bacterium]